MTDQAILEAIRSEDERGLRFLYHKYRDPCVRFLLAKVVPAGTPQRNDVAVDLFTEAVIVLVKNIRTGRLTFLSARLDTYLNAVARNIHRQSTRKAGREVYYDPADMPPPIVPDANNHVADEEVRQELYGHLNQLGDRCRQLIVHFYFLGLDWKTIAEMLNYKNAASAKTNKAKCMARLRKMYGLSPTKAKKK